MKLLPTLKLFSDGFSEKKVTTLLLFIVIMLENLRIKLLKNFALKMVSLRTTLHLDLLNKNGVV